MIGRNEDTKFLSKALVCPVSLLEMGIRYILTPDQTKGFYKISEKDSVVNVGTMTKELEEDRLNRDNDNDEENLYKLMNLNNFENNSVKVKTSEMEQWPIHSNNKNYVQCNRNPIDEYKLDVRILSQNIIKECIDS